MRKIKINQYFVSIFAFILMFLNVHFNMELTHWCSSFQTQIKRCALALYSHTIYRGETSAIAKSDN